MLGYSNLGYLYNFIRNVNYNKYFSYYVQVVGVYESSLI